ncbi:MAG: uncharacterized protein JWN04_5147 [Myxococcaceae bacterium]|nr:uncharacterized protein [Myxococcaceae bacterium]
MPRPSTLQTAFPVVARCLAFLVLTACGSSRSDDNTTEMNAATGDAASEERADAGRVSVLDASRLDAGDGGQEASVVVTNCLSPDSGIACDDGRFCSGVEVCNPADPSADLRGCVEGARVVCATGLSCSELMQQCSACSDSALDDADGDGHEAKSCGGDDCRDDDPAVFSGHPELCDGKDNDCDGVVDAAPADQACLAAAPAAATSSCVAGACAVVCTDPDFDVLAGVCVRHDDCAGISACAPGSCVDGVRAYTCSCPAGYDGAGTSACADRDECKLALDNCDTTPPACANTPGNFVCSCPSTHFGDGVGASGCVRKSVHVAAGDKRTCAVLAGGSVKCWGGQDVGQLGLEGSPLASHGNTPGTMGDALPSVKLGAGRTGVAIAVGSDVTCSLLDDGSAKCWGYNGYGATGASTTSAVGITTAFAPLPPGRHATAIGAGSGYGFALLDDGTLGYWGQSFAPFSFVPSAPFRAFDRSPLYDRFHVCAVLDDGAVRCWPGNAKMASYGQLGWAFQGVGWAASDPLTDLGTGRTATAVATGEAHSCALLDDATVKCWGHNDHGQLGQGDKLDRGSDPATTMGDMLRPIPFGAPVRAIAAGANHTCALFDAGVVKCWGLNDRGQLGQGTTEDQGDQAGEIEALVPVDLGPGRSASAIDLGSHSCAILDNGGIKCWGLNADGQLGQGDVLDRGRASGSLGAALREIDVGS